MSINFCNLLIIGRGGDCGIFVLKWMELMAHKKSIVEITQSKASQFRTRMAWELYGFVVLDVKDFIIKIADKSKKRKNN